MVDPTHLGVDLHCHARKILRIALADLRGMNAYSCDIQEDVTEILYPVINCLVTTGKHDHDEVGLWFDFQERSLYGFEDGRLSLWHGVKVAVARQPNFSVRRVTGDMHSAGVAHTAEAIYDVEELRVLSISKLTGGPVLYDKNGPAIEASTDGKLDPHEIPRRVIVDGSGIGRVYDIRCG
jgi:hypothetical protein